MSPFQTPGSSIVIERITSVAWAKEWLQTISLEIITMFYGSHYVVRLALNLWPSKENLNSLSIFGAGVMTLHHYTLVRKLLIMVKSI